MIKKYKEYEIGYKLDEDEFLLKIRPADTWSGSLDTGFLTKYNKDNTIPVAFKKWGIRRYYGKSGNPQEELPIYVFKESFKDGWIVNSFRFGESQNWAALIHPEGFTLEIYMNNFLEILKTTTIINGRIEGKYKWNNNKLIKEI